MNNDDRIDKAIESINSRDRLGAISLWILIAVQHIRCGRWSLLTLDLKRFAQLSEQEILKIHYGSFGEENMKEDNVLFRYGNIYGAEFGTGYAGNVWNSDYIYPPLMTMQGGVNR